MSMHQVQSRGAKYALTSAGFVASLICLLASMVANYRFGYTLGRTNVDGVVYGSVGVACDVFMAICPFLFFASWRNKEWTQALGSAVLWAAMTAFAATAAVSHASINRLDAAAHRTTAATTYQDTRTELTEARKARGFVPQHRPEAVVKAEIEKHKINRFWSQSTECTEASGKSQREYCAQYQTLVGELGYAKQGTALDARIADLVAKSDKAAESGAPVQAEADPAAKTWSLLLGSDIRTTQGILIFLMAFVVLLGASVGPYASFAMVFQPKQRAFVTINATAVGPEPPPGAEVEIKTALQAAPELKALPPPQKAKAPPAPVLAPEWQQLIDAIGYPTGKWAGALRDREGLDAHALRWFTWLCAHKHVGEITGDQLDKLHVEFVSGDHRKDPWKVPQAKGALAKLKWVHKRASVAPTTWTITAVAPVKLRTELVRRKVVDAAALPEEGKKPEKKPEIEERVPAKAAKTAEKVETKEATNVLVGPFVSGVQPANDVAPLPPPVAPEPPAKRKPVQGMAELQRGLPDMEALRRLTRHEKAMWQSRKWTVDRKQVNRMSRARAA
jgi:hypothetical protein